MNEKHYFLRHNLVSRHAINLLLFPNEEHLGPLKNNRKITFLVSKYSVVSSIMAGTRKQPNTNDKTTPKKILMLLSPSYNR